MNKLLDTRNDVKNFMVAGDQTLVGYTEQSDLYMNLITEELIHELLKEYDRKNLVGIADGIADSIVVIEGFCHSLGLDLERIWDFTYEHPINHNDRGHAGNEYINEILEDYVSLRYTYYDYWTNKNNNYYKNGRDVQEYSKKCSYIFRSLLGLSLCLKLPIQEIWDEVARSNNSKISENGKVIKNEFGKIQKPATFSPADIESILKRHNLI